MVLFTKQLRDMDNEPLLSTKNEFLSAYGFEFQ